MNIVSRLFGVTKVAGDIFLTCVFWYCFILLALMGLWELIEWLTRGPAEEPAARAGVGCAGQEPPCGLCETCELPPAASEPDEWEKLSEEEKEELRRFFK